EPGKTGVEITARPEAPTPVATAPGVRAVPAGYETSGARVASGRVHRAGAREPSVRSRVIGLPARGTSEVRPGVIVPARSGQMPARGSGEMPTADMSATEVATAAHGVPAPSTGVAPAPSTGVASSPACGMAATSTSGVALRLGQSWRTRYRNAEQQGSDGPYKSFAGSIHSHHPIVATAVLERSPATGLDASRARLFKLTYIKTQSRTGALTAISTMRAA